MDLEIIEKILSTARTPSYGDTSEGDWQKPTLKQYIDVYYKDKEKPEDVTNAWDSLPNIAKTFISKHTLLGDQKADNMRDGMFFPVVGVDNKLYKNALLAVIGGRGSQAQIGRDTLNSAQKKARALLEKEFEMEAGKDNKDNDTDEIVRKQFSFEIKATEDEEEDKDLFVGSFSGLASTFGNIDLGDDIIKRGAFKPALKKIKKDGRNPKALMQHNPWGDQGAIFTSLKETDEGLLVEGKFINTDRGTNLRVEVMTGAISDFSIGFRIGKSEMDENTGIRTIIEIKELPEISFVVFPMNTAANILDAKSRPKTVRDFEKLLKDNGYSSDEAKTIISKGLKALVRDVEDQDQRDADDKQKEIDNKAAEEAKKVKEAKYAEIAESFKKLTQKLKG